MDVDVKICIGCESPFRTEKGQPLHEICPRCRMLDDADPNSKDDTEVLEE